MGNPGVALRDLEASRDALPQKGGYPAPNRVTFLTGANRDFHNWRRHNTNCSSTTAGAKRSFMRQHRLVTDKEWHRTLSAAADVPRPMGENRAKFSVSQLEFCSLALQVTLNLRIWHQDRGDKSDGAHKSDVPIKAGFRATVLEPERNILC